MPRSRVSGSAYSERVPDVRDAARSTLDLPGVRAAVDEARDACTQLRWHEALRRRTAQAAAESRIRGARANAALDGAELPVGVVRDLVRGARPWSERPDPVETVVRGAVQATAETEHVRPLVLRAPAQVMARLHVAAASGLLPAEQVGRPRQGGETSRELVDLGPAPVPGEFAARLASLAELVAAAGELPVPVVAALVHAEICTARPFVLGNGLVARAMERCIGQAGGLDPTGVAVPEAGYVAQGAIAYVGALTAYGAGTPAGVALWLRHACGAMVGGAAEGRRIADAVLAGRLTRGD
jgi:hypothetical protein